MAGFKRKSYTGAPVKSRAVAKKSYRKTPYSAPRAPMRDSTKVMLQAYFEVVLTQTSTTGAGGTAVPFNDAPHCIAYSITCDANNCCVHTDKSGNGSQIVLTDGTTIVNSGTALPFQRLVALKSLFRQYSIQSVKANVTTDRECGLDNPILMSTDKGNVAPITSVANVMGQAHKSAIMTESRRTASYGWSPKTSADRDFHLLSSTGMNAADVSSIKFLQEVEPKINGVCKHRVQLTIVATLKDSKSTNQ